MLHLTKLKLRAHCYATEDVNKVRKAVENLLGNVKHDMKVVEVLGHYGDPIKVLEYSVASAEDAEEVFRKTISALGFETLGVEERSGIGGKLHLRVDKQQLYQGRIVPSDVDPVKLEFSYEGDWREVYRWFEST